MSGGQASAFVYSADLARARARRLALRVWINRAALTLSLLAMMFGVFWLIWILWDTLRLGIGGLNLATLMEMTPPPHDEGGGLANALYGSAVMVLLATFVGAPIGVMAGVYLAEYNARGWLARTTRFVNDILLSAPSIVIGMFIYVVIVEHTRSASGYAGALALALMVIPVVIRTTENMLRLVPVGQREAAYALGTPKWKVITRITLRAARAGVVTGILLAVARIAGETAPLLYTAANNQFWNTDMNRPMANLPVTILQFAMNIDANQRRLAWAGVFLITLGVLMLNILARAISRPRH